MLQAFSFAKINYEKTIIDLFNRHGLDTSYQENAGKKTYNSAFMQAYKSNVILEAGYGTTGGVHAELGRNLARVEPRFMNYLYTNLRTNLGFNAKDATEYLSSMLIRQGGIENKSTATLGMYLGMMSLSSLPGSEFTKELERLGGITRMNADDIAELKTFGQGRERALSEFLSRRDKGQILDDLLDGENFSFFGDNLQPGGNDYGIAQVIEYGPYAYSECHNVKNWKETWKILKSR